MTTPLTYDFGYSWWITWGSLVPGVVFAALAAAAIRRRWRTWVVFVCGVIAAWALASLVVIHGLFRLNLPVPPATDRFLAGGHGRVVDIGAGSGRATVGLLVAKPAVRVTAVDIYRGYFGIDENTPERLLANARIAGAGDRADAKIGDARNLPFAAGEFDGAVSVAAIDHVPRRDIPKALAEAARVLKPGGEFLLTIVNVDGWVLFASLPMAHHPRADPERWRTMLASAGFEIVEQGRQPGALFFYCRKQRAG
jgi:SAM-dependent methyltransferase